jgi:hypothetical protein
VTASDRKMNPLKHGNSGPLLLGAAGILHAIHGTPVASPKQLSQAFVDIFAPAVFLMTRSDFILQKSSIRKEWIFETCGSCFESLSSEYLS